MLCAAPGDRDSSTYEVSCPRLEFYTASELLQSDLCLALPPRQTFAAQLIAVSGNLDIAIQDLETSLPVGATVGTLTQISDSDSYYVNVTWTPQMNQWNQVHTFCFSALRSNGLTLSQSCISLVAGYSPPAPVRATATPSSQMVVHPHTTTWQIMFNTNIRRPSRRANISFHEYYSQEEVHYIDVSVPSSEVTFEQGNRISISPRSYMFAEQTWYNIRFGRGIVEGVEFCGPGNEPITDRNFWWFETLDITPPVITFLENPRISNTNVTFTWESNENATWECALVFGGAPSTINCSDASWRGFNLRNGSYTLRVSGRDLAGNVATVTHAFEVDLIPPVSTILTMPNNVSSEQVSTLTFSCNELPCTYQCQWSNDNNMTQITSSCNDGTFTTPSLEPDTNYTFVVTATDQVGNIGNSVSYSWETDFEAPTIYIRQNSSSLCTALDPQYTGEALVSDNRPEDVALTFNDVRLGCIVQRVWIATDIAGNTAQQPQNISLQVTPLSISLLSSVILPCDSTVSSQQVTGTTAFAPNPCRFQVPLQLTYQDSVSQYTCPSTFTRNWMLTSCGGSTTASQTITLYDLCPAHACGHNESVPHGTCSFGECQCNRPWYGDNCDILIYHPLAQPLNDSVLHEAQEYTATITLLQGTPPLTWIIINGPRGIQIDQYTGQISWTRPDAGNYTIAVVIQNQVGEAVITWNLQVLPGYRATLEQVVPATFPYAQPVVLNGSVEYLPNNYVERALAGIVPVQVDIISNGLRRTVSGFTTRDGNFSLLFYPVSTEYGTYTAGARHPSSPQALPQASWNVLGMRANPSSISLRGEAFNGQLDRTFYDVAMITSDGQGSLSGLSAYASLPSTMGINIEVYLRGFPSNVTLDPGEQLAMDIRIILTRLLRGSFPVIVESSEGTRLQLVVSLQIEAVLPSLLIEPPRLNTRIVRGIPRSFEFNVTNIGRNVATNVRAVLPNTNFVSLLSFGNAQQSEGSLRIGSGESAILSILAQTPATQQLGEIGISIAVISSEVSRSISMTLTVSSNSLLNFTVIVEDEYTYFAEGRPLVDNAIVTLINYQRNIRARQSTEAGNGTTVFVDIYEDRYEMFVEADGHRSQRQVIITSIDEPMVMIFLERQAVRYTWNVIPVPYEDNYIIPIVAEFETHVPIPVVTVTPAEIDLDNLESGRVAFFQMNITNHGLIRADNVNLQLPTSHPTLNFSSSSSTLGDLEALSSVIVPVHVTRRSIQKRSTTAWVIYNINIEYSYFCNVRQFRQVSLPIRRRVVCQTQLGPALRCRDSFLTQALCPLQPIDDDTPTEPPPPPRSPMTVFWLERYDLFTLPDVTSYFSGITAITPFICDQCEAAIIGCLSTVVPNRDAVPPATCTPSVQGSGSFGRIYASMNWVLCNGGDLQRFVRCLISNDAFQKCGEAPPSNRRKRNAGLLLRDLIEAVYPIEQSMALTTEVLGDDRWISVGDADWVTRVFTPTLDDSSESGVLVSPTELSTILAAPPPNGTAIEMVRRMVERVNNTISGWSSGQLEPTNGSNIASFSLVQEISDRINASNQAAIEKGFSSYVDAYSFASAELNMLDNIEAEVGVCAIVRIRILQELTLTREGFEARLEIENQESSPLEQINIEIVITDAENGERATHLFSIGNGTLSGSVSVMNGGWTLPSDMSGMIVWLMIPYSEAAPQSNHLYDVGGSFSYTVDGNNITVPLLPAPITVSPDPSLLVHYFLERHIVGDNPLTPATEASVPFTLGVAVRNAGYGTAYNLHISSGQPEVIDNERGLLINFMIIGANVGNDIVSPALTVMFGDLAPNTTTVARWYMLSSLQGIFSGYSATFENRNPLGDPRLSILDELETHVLTKDVMMYTGNEDDGILDFLVNDENDHQAYPDALYSSQTLNRYNVSAGVVMSVDATSNNETTSLFLRTSSNTTGWVYYRYEDIQGVLTSITSSVNGTKFEGRDNITIPPENAWITSEHDATTGVDTYYLHIFDYINTDEVAYNMELCITNCPVIQLPVKRKYYKLEWSMVELEVSIINCRFSL